MKKDLQDTTCMASWKVGKKKVREALNVCHGNFPKHLWYLKLVLNNILLSQLILAKLTSSQAWKKWRCPLLQSFTGSQWLAEFHSRNCGNWVGSTRRICSVFKTPNNEVIVPLYLKFKQSHDLRLQIIFVKMPHKAKAGKWCGVMKLKYHSEFCRCLEKGCEVDTRLHRGENGIRKMYKVVKDWPLGQWRRTVNVEGIEAGMKWDDFIFYGWYREGGNGKYFASALSF